MLTAYPGYFKAQDDEDRAEDYGLNVYSSQSIVRIVYTPIKCWAVLTTSWFDDFWYTEYSIAWNHFLPQGGCNYLCTIPNRLAVETVYRYD